MAEHLIPGTRVLVSGAIWILTFLNLLCGQDWNYVQARCMEITLELSPGKWPPPETLGDLFKANLDSMLALPLATMFSGVRQESSFFEKACII